MDKAKDAVKSFIGKSGHHDTVVDEHVNPAVTEEHIKPHRHEETTKAVDREVHQDHYHTTVQPLTHKETLPEKHVHNQLPVENREFVHGDSSRVKEAVQHEAAKFGDTTTTHGTTHSQSQAATVAGEHVHHHVHETVQPVINKETVQPEVVHTTRPVHETHHAQAEHHGISTLPTKTLHEFKGLGGAITGGSHRHEEYEGHPRPYNPALQSGQSGADINPASHDGHHTGTSHHTGTGVGGTTGTTGSTGHTGGLTGTTGSTGHTSGLTGSSGQNVSGVGSGIGPDYTSGGGATSTGTALGGRTEGNTVSRAVDTASGHGTGVGHSHSGTGAGVGAAAVGAGAAAAGASGLSGSHTGTGSGYTDTQGIGSSHSGIGGGHTGTSGLSGSHTGIGSGQTGSTGLSGSHTGTGSGYTDTQGVGSSHSGVGSGYTGSSGTATQGLPSRSADHSTTGYGSTSGSTTQHDRGQTDISSSTNTGLGRGTGSDTTHSGTERHVGDDSVQHASQGKDPNLVESSTGGSNLKGEGVPGSHSAVFGLTPDGKKYDDTQHGTGALKPAHSSRTSTTGNEDLGSRQSTGAGIAQQLDDPRVNERGHGGPSMTSTGSAKPGAGSGLGGQQGFGEVRPNEHGTESKLKDKLDPTTDADHDGKRGVGD